MGPPRNAINGVRPSPLSINKVSSQVIRKQSFPIETKANLAQYPVIIYAHSPKIIHSKPCDFMALVQRLTGLSRSEEIKRNINGNSEVSIDLNEAKPSLEDEDGVYSPSENCIEIKNSSHMFSPFSNKSLVDIPLYTPGSNNLFFSPQNLNGYGDSEFTFPNAASPSRRPVVESKKEIQQY